MNKKFEKKQLPIGLSLTEPDCVNILVHYNTNDKNNNFLI